MNPENRIGKLARVGAIVVMLAVPGLGTSCVPSKVINPDAISQNCPSETEMRLLAETTTNELQEHDYSFDKVGENEKGPVFYPRRERDGRYYYGNINLQTATILFHITDPSLLNQDSGIIYTAVHGYLKERQTTYDSPQIKSMLRDVFNITANAARFLNRASQKFLSPADFDFNEIGLTVPKLPVDQKTYSEHVSIAPRNGRGTGYEFIVLGGYVHHTNEFNAVIVLRDIGELGVVINNPNWRDTEEGQQILKSILNDVTYAYTQEITADGKYNGGNHINGVLREFFIDLALRKAGVERPGFMPTGGIALYDALVEAYSKTEEPDKAKALALERMYNWMIHPTMIPREFPCLLSNIPYANTADDPNQTIRGDKAGLEDGGKIEEIAADLDEVLSH